MNAVIILSFFFISYFKLYFAIQFNLIVYCNILRLSAQDFCFLNVKNVCLTESGLYYDNLIS